MFPEFRRAITHNPVGRASPPHERTAMNLTRWTNLLAIGLTLSFAAVGCRTHPVGVTRIPGHPERPVGGNPPTLPPVQPYDANTTDQRPLGPGHPNWPEDPEKFKAN